MTNTTSININKVIKKLKTKQSNYEMEINILGKRIDEMADQMLKYRMDINEVQADIDAMEEMKKVIK